METIHFPTTPDKFIAHQEKLIGRTLSEGEKEATAEWVKAFNRSYRDGLNQDRDALDEDLARVNEFIARHGDNLGIHKFMEACRAWISEAWNQGAESDGQ